MPLERGAVNGVIHEKYADSNGVTKELYLNSKDIDSCYIKFFAPDGTELKNGEHRIGDYHYDIRDWQEPEYPYKKGQEIKLFGGRIGKAVGPPKDNPARQLLRARRARQVDVWVYHNGGWTHPVFAPDLGYESFGLTWTNYPSTEEERQSYREDKFVGRARIEIKPDNVSNDEAD